MQWVDFQKLHDYFASFMPTWAPPTFRRERPLDPALAGLTVTPLAGDDLPGSDVRHMHASMPGIVSAGGPGAVKYLTDGLLLLSPLRQPAREFWCCFFFVPTAVIPSIRGDVALSCTAMTPLGTLIGQHRRNSRNLHFEVCYTPPIDVGRFPQGASVLSIQCVAGAQAPARTFWPSRASLPLEYPRFDSLTAAWLPRRQIAQLLEEIEAENAELLQPP